MKTGVKVVDAMTESPIIVNSKRSITYCAKKMLDSNVGSILVKEGEELLGILTEKDLVDKVVSKELNTSKTKVEEIMTKKESIVTISPSKDLYEAIVLMNEEGRRRLPVVDGEKVIGLLTYKDVLKLQPDLYYIYAQKLKMDLNKE